MNLFKTNKYVSWIVLILLMVAVTACGDTVKTIKPPSSYTGNLKYSGVWDKTKDYYWNSVSSIPVVSYDGSLWMAKYVVEKGLTPSVENNWVTFGGSAISLKAGSANVHVTKTGEMYTIAVDEGVPAPDLPARDQIKVLQGTANFNDAPPITLTAAKAAIDINTAKVGRYSCSSYSYRS